MSDYTRLLLPKSWDYSASESANSASASATAAATSASNASESATAAASSAASASESATEAAASATAAASSATSASDSADSASESATAAASSATSASDSADSASESATAAASSAASASDSADSASESATAAATSAASASAIALGNLTTVSTTWSALKTLRDAGELVAGLSYRITDYETTTTQADTQSAGHVFDIIVTADTADTLNENARACLHDGDTYFQYAHLEAWKLKYCLDNDTNRFHWADDTDGKGVIYELEDEFKNKAPYDFKNIQFKRYMVTATTKTATALVNTYSGAHAVNSISYYPQNCTLDKTDYIYCYTFDYASGTGDYSLNQLNNGSSGEYAKYCYKNEIAPLFITPVYNGSGTTATYTRKQVLNNIVFRNTTTTSANYANRLTGVYAHTCTFGNDCYSNTFGNDCSSNTFGNYCNSNTFGNYCTSNTFGNSCFYNTADDFVLYITLADSSCYLKDFLVLDCENGTETGLCLLSSPLLTTTVNWQLLLYSDRTSVIDSGTITLAAGASPSCLVAESNYTTELDGDLFCFVVTYTRGASTIAVTVTN